MTRTRWFDVAAIVLAIADLRRHCRFSLVPEEWRHRSRLRRTYRIERPQPPPTPGRRRCSSAIRTPREKSSAEMSYGCMAAVQMGWLCALSAIGGNGIYQRRTRQQMGRPVHRKVDVLQRTHPPPGCQVRSRPWWYSTAAETTTSRRARTCSTR